MHIDHKVMYALCASLRPQICIESRDLIVIALKRNGVYADDIQVQQLGLRRVV
jgi:hypothetical protein